MKYSFYIALLSGALMIGCNFSGASFSDNVEIAGNHIASGIWNPGKATITAFVYDPIGLDSGKENIEISNTGGYLINLKDYILHFNGVGNSDFVFPDVSLLPGNALTIHLRATGVDTDTDLFWSDTGNNNMGNAAGSISLFKSLPKNATNIVDFVQYGAAGQNQENNAITAGIWTAGSVVPDANEGSIIELVGKQDHNLASDWSSRLP